MPHFINHGDDEECQTLRQFAGKAFQRRNFLLNNGATALARRQEDEGNKLLELAEKKRHEADHYNRLAAEYAFGANNPRGIRQKIDLHGLHVNEAECYCKQCIFESVEKHRTKLCLIVGRGSHSRGGLCRLLGCVILLCERASLTYHMSKRNPGAVTVNTSGAHIPSSWSGQIETLFSLSNGEKAKLIIFLTRLLISHRKPKHLRV